MNQPFGIYVNDPINFHEQKDKWNLFKCFLENFTSNVGGDKQLYINDGIFQGIEDIANHGGTITEMIDSSEKIIVPCKSTSQFIKNHTSVRDDGIININGDVWFSKEIKGTNNGHNNV